jgi:N-acyl-D-amino-acid deacylase
MTMKKGLPLLSLLAAAMLLLPACAAKKRIEPRPQFEFDLLIADGMLVDGSGDPPERMDVGIKGDRIIAVDLLAGRTARRVIDASGLYVMPGIIDVHNHADAELAELPDAQNLVRQGITTLVTGNCGGSAYPVGEFFAELERKGITPNVAILVGHNTIREKVMGMEARKPTAAELEQMKALLRAGMEEGAVGLSTGLKYPPGIWADTDEVVELAKVAAEYKGIYTSHMRDEGRGVLDSVRETIEIGRRAGLPVQISHHKIASRDLWGAAVQTLALVDAAVKEGLEVNLDQYPYPATSTGLSVLFPPWSLAGGQEKLIERLNDPQQRPKIAEGIVDNILHDRGGSDPSNILIAHCSARPDAEGRNISQLLEEAGREVNLQQAAEIIMEIQEEGGASAIYRCLADEDIERIMRHPRTMIATDSHICRFGEGVPHPRNYGTFTRVLGLYVREKGVLTLPQAVSKMTALPAQTFFLFGRGLIVPQFAADIVIFNPDTVAETATWTEPHQYPTGIEYVIINGTVVVEDGRQLDVRPGKVLRHKPFKRR